MPTNDKVGRPPEIRPGDKIPSRIGKEGSGCDGKPSGTGAGHWASDSDPGWAFPETRCGDAEDLPGKPERRQRTDFWVRLLTGFNGLAWLVIAAILILAGLAKPQFESFFDRFYHLKIRVWWDLELIRHLLYLNIAGTVLSSAGLVLSLRRARRSTDRSRVPLLLMGAVSVIALVCVLVFF
jgi:hypothetical protein